MLIVTESLNADREPNKTHNEPSPAHPPDSAAGNLAGSETPVNYSYKSKDCPHQSLRSILSSDPDQ